MRWVLAVLVVGCHGSQAVLDAPLDDSVEPFPDASADACDPSLQTGCPGINARCAWIVDQNGGHRGCIGLAGDEVAIGEACEYLASGHDNCGKGAVCVDGICSAVCQLHQRVSGCDAQSACLPHTGIFDMGGESLFGSCQPTCDPLTQIEIGGVAACSSANPAAPSRGCYTIEFEEFACAGVMTGALDRTDRVPAVLAPGGSPEMAGCAPGFVPLLVETTGSTLVTCTGLCAPLEIDNTQPQNALGDPAAVAKLPRAAAPAAGNATCAAGKKGSESPADCMYLWPFLEDQTGANPFGEAVGVCIAYTHFQFDSDGDSIPDTAFPGCENLPPRSAATPGAHDDAADFGCQKIAHTAGGITSLGLRAGAIATSATQ